MTIKINLKMMMNFGRACLRDNIYKIKLDEFFLSHFFEIIYLKSYKI